MEILLVRHTSVAVAAATCYGQTDIHLQDTFMEEKRQIFSKLTISNQLIVYSSPAKRCTQLANYFSTDYRIDNRLLELNFGDWENQLWTDIPESQLNPWMNDFVNSIPPNGESFSSLHSRVQAFLNEVIQTSHSQIAIITHAGVIRSMLCECLGIPLQNAFRLKIDYGSISRIEYQNDLPLVLSINL